MDNMANTCERRSLRVENDHHANVRSSLELLVTSGTTGLLRGTGNATNHCALTTAYAHDTDGTLVLIDGSEALTYAGRDAIGLKPPPYAHTPDDAGEVQTQVTTHAGTGRGVFAPERAREKMTRGRAAFPPGGLAAYPSL